MTVKSSISLNDAQDSFARELMARGGYSSLSAVVQQGLELLRQKTEADEVEIKALRLLLNERQKGAFVGADEMRALSSQMIAEKRRARGLDG